jgi:hypothetical protein
MVMKKIHLVQAPLRRTKPILFQSDHANTSALMQVVVLAVPANGFTLGRMWMTRRPGAYFVEEKITERANVNCALGQRASKVSRLAQGEEEEIMVEAQLQLQMRQHQQSVAKRVLQLSKPPRTPTRRRLPHSSTTTADDGSATAEASNDVVKSSTGSTGDSVDGG